MLMHDLYCLLIQTYPQYVPYHCVKSVEIRSFFWSVFSRIWTEYWKIRTRKTPYFDTFHAVYIYIMQHIYAFVHIRNVLNLFLKLLELRDPFTNAQFYPLIIQFIQQYEFYHH